MNWSDWEMIWREQELPLGPGADVAVLKRTFETKRRKLRRGILVRNVLEGFVGVFGSVILGWLGWRFGLGGWRLWTGTVLMFCVSLVFVFDFFRAHRSRVVIGASLLAQVDAEIDELRHQRHLIANIGSWYFLPYASAIGLICSALGEKSARNAPPGFLHEVLTTPSTLGFIVAILVISIGAILWAWRSSLKAVRKRLDPRLAELEKLRDDILSNTSSSP